MTKSAAEELDSEELLHLAILASGQNRHEESISLLKRAQSKSPNQGKILYLLGAEHAQIGLYDRAVEEMSKAVSLDPNLHVASFQLGLLHVTSGRIDQAAKAWQLLDPLGKENPLYLFKTGLLHLVKDEFEDCARCLRQGIAANTQNEPLNRDMQRVLGDVEGRLGTAAKAEPADTKTSASNHVLLSAYQKNRGDDADGSS